jgi:hypothetical protein
MWQVISRVNYVEKIEEQNYYLIKLFLKQECHCKNISETYFN